MKRKFNNRGQDAIVGMGLIILTFIGVLVGVILFQAVAQEAGKSTTLQTKVNDTITAAAENETVNLAGKALEGDIVVLNSTNVDVSSQFTVLNNQIDSTTGDLTAQLQTDAGANEAGNVVNVSYTYQPTGYITSSGGRSMTSLIAIFFALAIAVVALVPTLRSSVLEMISR